MMEGNLIGFLAFMGGLSLYLVIATIVGRSIYTLTRKWDEGERIAAAVFGGGLFPITVPIGVFLYWVYTIITIPLNGSEDNGTDVEECSQEVVDVRERVSRLEEGDEPTPSEPEPKPKFKVGDLITGVSENPAGYKHLYEGCACRVIEVDGNKPMKVILVDHIDFNAHREEIGQIFKAPQRYFTLLPTTKKRKAVASKKKPTKKVAKKRK